MAFCDAEHKFKSVGKNVVIGKNVYFRYPELVEIGDNVIIDEFCVFTTQVRIGRFVHIGPFCSVTGGRDGRFIMEDFSGLAAGCRIACSSDDYLGSGMTNPTIPLKYRARVTTGSVTLKQHVVLGTGVVVHPNVVVGEGSVVGSLSLVTKSLHEWAVWVGSPARYIKPRPHHEVIAFATLLQEEVDNAG